MREKISGIYKIVNTINGKKYVGSAVNISTRWGIHKRELNNNTHHSIKLQRAWNKHGESAFEFSVIEECEPIKEILEEREQFWMDYYKAYDNHNYNVSKIAGRSMQGRSHSSDSKTKMSEAKKGKPGPKHSEETKLKMSKSKSGENHPLYGLAKEDNPNYGKKHTPAARANMSAAHKGKFVGELSPSYGKTPSDETRAKLSAANKGKTHSEETKAKMSAANKGKHPSEETRRKLSEAAKKREEAKRLAKTVS